MQIFSFVRHLAVKKKLKQRVKFEKNHCKNHFLEASMAINDDVKMPKMKFPLNVCIKCLHSFDSKRLNCSSKYNHN